MVLVAGFCGVLQGCASSSFEPGTPETQPDRVLGRIDGMDDRPDWLEESKPFVIGDGMVTSLGGTEIPADHRIDAAYRIAQSNASAEIAGAIEKRLEFIFQNAEEGTAVGATQARYIGAEATRLLTSSMRLGNRYWERIAYTTDSGRRQTKYRVFASVSMPEDEFKRAILDAVRKASGKLGLSADFGAKVDRHWDEFTSQAAQGGVGTSPASARSSSRVSDDGAED